MHRSSWFRCFCISRRDTDKENPLDTLKNIYDKFSITTFHGSEENFTINK